MKRLLLLVSMTIASAVVFGQSIKGSVTDSQNGETLPGAYITIEGTDNGTITDFDGTYSLDNLPSGQYTLIFSFLSYESKKISNIIVSNNKTTQVNASLDEAGVQLDDIQIVGRKRTDTDLSLVKDMRTSLQVVSGISSQQISKSIDKDASEVVRRVSGTAIQNDRFIIVRGLNQRYNNIWVNHAATPSSEIDSRAFSFDLIPSGLIDNLLISLLIIKELSHPQVIEGAITIFKIIIYEKALSNTTIYCVSNSDIGICRIRYNYLK